jgi:transcriptional regulator GlxA family with amidase domain
VYGLEVTTHHGALDLLAATAPAAVVRGDRRFIDNGRVVTSAGISAGIDAALHVVARLLGDAQARETATYMEYDWQSADPSAAGHTH